MLLLAEGEPDAGQTTRARNIPKKEGFSNEQEVESATWESFMEDVVFELDLGNGGKI